MANKACLINKALNLGALEQQLTRRRMLEQHPLVWLVEVNGLTVDARILPPNIEDEARRRGLIPDPPRSRNSPGPGSRRQLNTGPAARAHCSAMLNKHD
jgi:hypothetical protein